MRLWICLVMFAGIVWAQNNTQQRFLRGTLVELKPLQALIKLDNGQTVEEPVSTANSGQFIPGATVQLPQGRGLVERLVQPRAVVRVEGKLVEGPYSPGISFKPGQRVLLQASGDSYVVIATSRLPILYGLIALFVLVAVVVGRGRGLRGIIGTALSLLVVFYLMVPLIAQGYHPLLVVFVGSLFILVFTIYLVHGFNLKSHAALTGTVFATLFGLLLTTLATRWLGFTGLVSEEAVHIQFNYPGIDLLALYMASVVVGVLGALNDVTVTQASVVEQIARVNPRYGLWELYRRAMAVGFDHIGSLINTLVLAHLSTALLLMLRLHQEIRITPLSFKLNAESYSAELVALLISCTALILAVPFTTLLAARLFHGGGGRNVEQRWPERKAEPRNWVQEMLDKEK